MLVTRYVQILSSVLQNEKMPRNVTADDGSDEGLLLIPSLMKGTPLAPLLFYAGSVVWTRSIVSRGITAHKEDLPRVQFYQNSLGFTRREAAFNIALCLWIGITEFYRGEKEEPPEFLVFLLTTLLTELSLNLPAGLYDLCTQENGGAHFFLKLKNILLQTTFPNAAIALLTYRYSFDILYRRDSIANKWLWMALAGAVLQIPRQIATFCFSKMAEILSSCFKPNSVIEIVDEESLRVRDPQIGNEAYVGVVSETEAEESLSLLSASIESRRSHAVFGSAIPWLLLAPIVTMVSWCMAAVLCAWEDAWLQDDNYNDYSLPLLQVATGMAVGLVVENFLWGMVMGVQALCHKQHLPQDKEKAESEEEGTHEAYSPFIEEEAKGRRNRLSVNPPKLNRIPKLSLDKVERKSPAPSTLSARLMLVNDQNKLGVLKRRAGIMLMTKSHNLNYVEARKDLEYAAKQGDELAWCYLGFLYEYGLGVEISLDAALFCYDKANVSIGKSHALIKLVQGLCYLRRLKIGSCSSAEYAIDMFLEAIDLKDQCKAEDWQSTIDFLKSMAKKLENVGANLILALIYDLRLLGINVDSEADYYYERASKRAESWTQYNLGMVYQNKRWPCSSYAQTYRWLSLSIESNHRLVDPIYWYNLGLLYRGGLGVSQNYSEAIRCFEQACQLGSSVAHEVLAEMYENGWGCNLDLDKAAKIRNEDKGKRDSRRMQTLLMEQEDLPNSRISEEIQAECNELISVVSVYNYYDESRVDRLPIRKQEILHVRFIAGKNWLYAVNESGMGGKVPRNAIRLKPAQEKKSVQPLIKKIDEKEIEYVQNLYEGPVTCVSLGSWKGAQVVIKKLKEYVEKNEKEVEVIINEYELMAQLDNPYIVKLVGITNTTPPKIIIEYMIYGSVGDFLKRNETEFIKEKRLDIALHIAQALRYLHEKRILHRDIKSYNVLLGPYYEEPCIARLADFGTAIQCRRGTKARSSRQIGTQDWLSPELCGVVQVYFYTVESDSYAYGVFLWELFTFLEARFVKEYLLNKHELSVPEMPPKIETLIRGCCAEHPMGRPPMSDVVNKLLKQCQNLSNEKAKEEAEEDSASSQPNSSSWKEGNKSLFFQQVSSPDTSQTLQREYKHFTF